MRGKRFLRGLLILSSERIIDYKRKIRKEFPIEDVAEVELGAHPGGFVLFSVISTTAAEYAAFKDQGGNTAAGIRYWENQIQTKMSDPKLARHTSSLIEGESARARGGS